ncbi:hypothetical protein, partial [Escherichia coli]|uniref:hypothetical protein n=1 Tax=Escherichia coli TaxID=562 RepID=UPI00200CAA85
ISPEVLDFFTNIFKKAEAGIVAVENAVGNITGNESLIENDLMDAVFKNSGPSRTYEVRFNLPCLTVQDSMKAGEIIRAFEALSLPTARSLFS